MDRPCITSVRATVCALLGLPAPEGAEPAAAQVIEAAKVEFTTEPMPYASNTVFSGALCDRVFMYDPDAIAQWVFEKYRECFSAAIFENSLILPMLSVVPPVTPVCFGSMYSGVQPKVHGIIRYEKPVLKVPTLFDDVAASGRRAAIVSTTGDSISLIFLERDIDYYIYDSVEKCNKKALELIEADKYDLIVLYNGDYDYRMHRVGPEGRAALKALDANVKTFSILHEAVKKNWQGHRTALAFAPDHGCHRWLGLLGTHGKDIPQDMHIDHIWTFI